MNRRDAVVALVALGAAAGSRASLAQPQGKIWRVGILSPTSASLSSSYTKAFLKGMRELGYIEGRNLVVEWRFADGKLERLPGLAAELVQLKVDVIVVQSSPAISAAQKATTTIPIVMTSAGDPVRSGFVKSLARPGGNITGLSIMSSDTGAKLLELLRSVVPKLARVAVLTPSASYGNIAERPGHRAEGGCKDSGGRGIDAAGDRERVLNDGPGESRRGHRGLSLGIWSATPTDREAGTQVPHALDVPRSGDSRKRRVN
jgi:putative tryptophan/tyrosine transport system substrate-binding protein